ncbi:MAG: hypothetical protein JXB48_23915 [Candidatus Latescibacteria bacterium]|nr:hypothetical protein [Candidatus Latescibacterota bacterium]
MKQTLIVISLGFFILLLNVLSIFAAPGRFEQELSGENWRLWLDLNAEWINDDIYLPPVSIGSLPVNPPTIGWDNLEQVETKVVSVPGTVEEHFWSANGNNVGIAGDYRGVSWWSTTFRLNPEMKGKIICIAFESVNLRAEVFVNHQLVGYDVIGNTPFEIDATSAVKFGIENRLDIRITDPGGNFSWPAHTIFPWGKNMIPIVRGFGGITGKVTLRAVDRVYITDIYVQNTPQIKEADVHITLHNSSNTSRNGKMILKIHEWKNPSNIIWEKEQPETIPAGDKEISFNVKASKAKIWDLHNPHLYIASVTVTSADGDCVDTMDRRFGFRWFDIGEKNGDQRLYLNGKRVFMMATVNRGYWAGNGMYATPERAKKDIDSSLAMGYNSIAFHNAIGQPLLVQLADEYGLLCTGESGGYRINDDRGKPWPDETTRALRREKLIRFVKRDRSYPSIIAYMLKNEDNNPADEDDKNNMALIRKLDPSRILLYTGDCDRERREYANLEKHPLKLFFKPLDSTEYYSGWFDKHHWNRDPGYLDDYYRNPRNYMRLNVIDGDSTRHVPKDEIIFYGEEGAFGTMLRLGKIREELYKKGTSDGWREGELIDWYNAYDAFLDESGFRSSFTTVDALTLALGKNMHYFHGRIIENARISNVIDAYNLNGWASAATHSDIADAYRYPTGDTSILKYYNQPLYVAVKIRDKVMPVGTIPVADIYIVNQVDLKGKHTLTIEMADPDRNQVFSKSLPVNISGGEEFGQLLLEGVQFPSVLRHGYYTVTAYISSNNEIKCSGHDEIFSVDLINGDNISGNIAVVDTTGIIRNFLKTAKEKNVSDFSIDTPQSDYIIVGSHNFGIIRRNLYTPIMEQVSNGSTLIVLENADVWAQQLDDVYGYQSIQYSGSGHLGSRGRLFVGKSKLLKDLPVSQAMGWEYQVFYRSDIWGLDIGHTGNETVVALAAQHRKDILTSVAYIPFGRGKIIVSTLDIMTELESERPQSAIAKKLFLNFIECSNTKN